MESDVSQDFLQIFPKKRHTNVRRANKEPSVCLSDALNGQKVIRILFICNAKKIKSTTSRGTNHKITQQVGNCRQRRV